MGNGERFFLVDVFFSLALCALCVTLYLIDKDTNVTIFIILICVMQCGALLTVGKILFKKKSNDEIV
ncbi:MAG: hypothetical protein FWF56_06960 [Firmicutes bacterium]|nr:hypothetical protein [Bacillota bacterium]MCL1953217.1 hypothetical protein [Bacillota bacterium]